MPLSIAQWHRRYQQQSRWTRDLRFYIYNQVNLSQANKILDVGCGTGVLESELAQFASVRVFGLDINHNSTRFAQQYTPNTAYTTGNCLHLPYQADCFDITLCHFLLLWIYASNTRNRGIIISTGCSQRTHQSYDTRRICACPGRARLRRAY